MLRQVHLQIIAALDRSIGDDTETGAHLGEPPEFVEFEKIGDIGKDIKREGVEADALQVYVSGAKVLARIFREEDWRGIGDGSRAF